MTHVPVVLPAFPTTGENNLVDGTGRGMSLRDYFAGQVLPGVLQLKSVNVRAYSRLGPDAPIEHCVARLTYNLADAMLGERTR